MKYVLLLSILTSFHLFSQDIVIENYKIESSAHYSHDIGKSDTFLLHLIVATEEAIKEFDEGVDVRYEVVKYFNSTKLGYYKVSRYNREEDEDLLIRLGRADTYIEENVYRYELSSIESSRKTIKNKIQKEKSKGKIADGIDEEANYLLIASSDYDFLGIIARREYLKGVQISLDDLANGTCFHVEYEIPSFYKIKGKKSSARVSFDLKQEQNAACKKTVNLVD